MEDSDWLKNPQQEAFCLTEISWLQGFPDSAPAMQEPPFGSLGQEYSLGEEMATHSSILAWSISMDRGTWWATVHEITKS